MPGLLKMGDGGKGSAPRPIPNRKSFDENWERIFNSKPNAKQFGELNMGNRDKPKREAKKPKKQQNPL